MLAASGCSLYACIEGWVSTNGQTGVALLLMTPHGPRPVPLKI